MTIVVFIIISVPTFIIMNKISRDWNVKYTEKQIRKCGYNNKYRMSDEQQDILELYKEISIKDKKIINIYINELKEMQNIEYKHN